jgi:ribosomal protein S18 acetylase RimI-like enzyme
MLGRVQRPSAHASAMIGNGLVGAHEADRMYLQVECDNIPALRLYERAGFDEVCGYHYRTPG